MVRVAVPSGPDEPSAKSLSMQLSNGSPTGAAHWSP
jgi:hypothetical protein